MTAISMIPTWRNQQVDYFENINFYFAWYMDNKGLSAAVKQSRDDDVMIMVSAFIN